MQEKSSLENIAARGNDLFNLADADTLRMYQDASDRCGPCAISRDTSSNQEIEEAVQAAAQIHAGKDGMVILDGAYMHIIGAIVKLAKSGAFNVRYVPVDGWQVSTQTKNGDGNTIQAVMLGINVNRALGVTKSLGFRNMEAVRAYLDAQEHDPQKPTLTFVAFNQTGMHWLYDRSGGVREDMVNFSFKEAEKRNVQLIMNEVTDHAPGFVVGIGEDWETSQYESMLKGGSNPRTGVDQLLVTLHAAGLPVRIGAFGIQDRLDNPAPSHKTGLSGTKKPNLG